MKRSPISFLSQSLLLCLTLLIAVASCRKKDDVSDVKTPTQLSDADSLKYLMYHVMEKSMDDGGRNRTTVKPLYYWYNQVPAIDPLSSDFSSAADLLEKMKSYTRDDQGRVRDRYSFLDDGTVVDQLFGGKAGDIGMEVTYVRDQSGTIFLVVISTDKNSPSGQAGVNRGWIVTSINNQSVAWDNGGPNYKRVLNAVYYDDQATFGFQKPDGTTQTISLAKAEYELNPILFDTVYNIAGKEVGYFVFNTFSAVKSQAGSPTVSKIEIDKVFNLFASKNISSLIIDLRYNGGGDVSTVEYLADKIGASSLGDKLMFKTDYNDILAPTRNTQSFFDGSGNLNLQNVFVVATRRTASASEVLYNSLRPYMEVKLIGDTTYGKPVGMAVVPITTFKAKQEELLAYLFPISFETLNADNQGGYYQGLIPDKKAADFVNVPWGDPSDDNLEKIFSYLSTGNFGGRFMSPEERMRTHPDLKVPIPNKLPSLRYNGMVDLNQRLILK